MRVSREMEQSEQRIILSEKRKGETMGQLTKRVRHALSLPSEIKIAFAGRLDPLATGLVIFTVDDHHLRDEVISMHKTYSFDVVFGLQTDSGDILGSITKTNDYKPSVEEIRRAARRATGNVKQTYPLFSSKTVEGKPLFKHAREKSLDHKKIPDKEIEIFSLSLKRCSTRHESEFKREVETCIASVRGDFRQESTRRLWNSYFNEKRKDRDIQSCSFVARVSSGTYIRTLARRIAEMSNSVGIAHNIQRQQIGKYHVTNARI